MPQFVACRQDGYLPLKSYAALGDGRSVALSGADGSIDWWCVPNMDSPSLFNRILSAEEEGRFSITPDESLTAERRYDEAGSVRFEIAILFGTRAHTCSPYLVPERNGTVLHASGVLGLIRRGPASCRPGGGPRLPRDRRSL